MGVRTREWNACARRLRLRARKEAAHINVSFYLRHFDPALDREAPVKVVATEMARDDELPDFVAARLLVGVALLQGKMIDARLHQKSI